MSLPDYLPAESAPPVLVQSVEAASTPYMIKLYEDVQACPVGISYLGGVAVFSPESTLLTLREKQCASLSMIGDSNHAIGRELFLSEDTVKTHFRRIFKKLDVESRAGLLDRCLDQEVGVMVLASVAAPDRIPLFSRREKETITEVAKGKSNNALAEEIVLPPMTVKSHMARIWRKLDYTDRSILASVAVFGGFTDKAPAQYPDGPAAVDFYRTNAALKGRKLVRRYTTLYSQARSDAVLRPVPSAFPQHY